MLRWEHSENVHDVSEYLFPINYYSYSTVLIIQKKTY